MKIVDVKCPHCGGELHIAEDRKECYCEFCGSHLMLDDGNVKTVMVIRDEAKLRELDLEYRKREDLKQKIAELEEKDKKAKRRTTFDYTLYVALFLTLVAYPVVRNFITDNASVLSVLMPASLIAATVLIMSIVFRMVDRHRYEEELASAQTRLNLMDLKDVDILKHRK